MARSPTVIDNTSLNLMFMNYDGFSELPNWIQDVMVGASRLGHSNPSSPIALFHGMRTLKVISLETVERFVNNKSTAVDNRTFGRSHVYAFMNRLIACKRSIEFHYERRYNRTIPDFYYENKADTEEFEYADGVKYSEVFCKNQPNS
ncbi:hypothetical protein PQC38_gp084 [Aeromonas phage BUCT695]|uniref:hypothetical protein n=1 Tax=Aeromonas phage BUCT695 TaxID=2908630 RepID=UPI00232937F0|nr:hypothetical protein PQC38_gp084 [Aeromonas phage BUCT695]UIW10560.1 hypothetical protein [Aeromonas phage BUCT695]